VNGRNSAAGLVAIAALIRSVIFDGSVPSVVWWVSFSPPRVAASWAPVSIWFQNASAAGL
jgi:hypothetical protein